MRTENNGCESMRRAISECSAEQLRAALPVAIKAHIENCGRCKAYASEMAGLASQLDALAVPAPAEAYPWLVANLPGRPIITLRTAFLVGLLMAVIAAAVIGWYHFSRPRLVQAGNLPPNQCVDGYGHEVEPHTENPKPLSSPNKAKSSQT